MTFEALHKWVLYATVVLALLPMATSGELSAPLLVLAYGAIVASWFFDAPLQRVDAHTRWWNLGTVAALAVLAFFAWSTGDYIRYAIYFSLLMVVTRLFQSRSSRDVFQLYGLTFIAMLAGAVINPTLTFLAAFVAYVVLLVWGLVLLHIQRDIEALQEEQAALGERPADLAWKARDLVTGRFLFGSSVLALGIFAASLVVFFFFPRLGMGFFFSQGREGQSVSGFANEIQLGRFGTIKDDYRVVMRVEYPDDPTPEGRTLRMRGISFDRYDGRRNMWVKSTGEPSVMGEMTDFGTWVVRHDAIRGFHVPGEEERQSVYLEPFDTSSDRMVFGEPRIRTIAIDHPDLDRLRRDRIQFRQDIGGDLSTVRTKDRLLAEEAALRYHVVSQKPRRDGNLLRKAAGALPPHVRGYYLQLPNELDPRIPALAKEITAGLSTDFDRAVAVEKHLLANYGYTVEGGVDPDHPLEEFLFVRKKGHCEYFSSAMVLLLRTLGIPARPANGFFGGVWNDFGRYYAVRQADAHSWTEVFFPGYGWFTFDATPPSMVLVPPEEGVLGTANEWFDSLRLQWYKWVVEYDLQKQIDFFQAIAAAMGDLRDLFPQPVGSPKSPRAWKKGIAEWAKRPLTWVLVASPFVLALLLRLGAFHALRDALRRLLRRREKYPGGKVGALYHHMLRTLTRQGVGRRTGETPRDLARRLAEESHPAAAEIARLTAAWESVRYAEREVSADQVPSLEEDLRAVRKV